jgi:hypothetical protein
MSKNSKKSEGGKGKRVEAAAVQGDDDFDDMLAEPRATDVTAESANARGRSSSSSSRSSKSSGTEISEDMITEACIRGDVPPLR